MNSITQILTFICYAALVCTLFYTLLPANSMNKTVKLVISLFFVTAVLHPIGSVVSDMPSLEASVAPAVETEEYAQAVRRRICLSAEERLCAVLADILAENGVVADKVSVNVNTCDDGSIIIECVQVVLNSASAYKLPLASSVITSAVGQDTTVSVTVE